MAFHPLPQLIQAVFNRPWFGLPRHVTDASSWSWQDHSASGLPHATVRPIQTRFRYGSVPTTLNLAAYDNSPAHYAKGTQSDPKILLLLVSAWFQVLFHSPPGVLFTFPSRYWFTIGNRQYLALADGPARFPQDFSCPAVLGISFRRLIRFVYGAITLYGLAFQPARLQINFVTP